MVPRNAEAGKRPTPDAQESSLPEAPEGTKALTCLLFPTQAWHFLFFCAVFFSGLVYLHENAPSLEEIDHVLRADVRQPYTLKLVLNLIASVVNALVFGPPTWKAAETTPSFKDKAQAMMKMVFVVYLLCSALYGWWHDIQAIAGIADRQFKEIVGWPEVLRFSVLVCVETATGGMWSKFVEVYLLIHVYHEFHNFCILHWRGEGGLQACSPCNQGEVTGFRKEMTGPMRMAFLIRKMGQANGPLYETYMILVLLRCLPFAWIFSFWHLVAFFILYPWCSLLLWSCVMFMRLVAVEPLLWWLRRKHVKQRQSGKGRFGRSQLKAGGFTFTPFSESESEFLLESRRQLATVGFLPGHFDRRLPGLLRIRKLPKFPVMAKIQADHEEELDVLKAKIQDELDVLNSKIQADHEEELDVLKAKIQADLDVLKAKIQADHEEELDVLKAKIQAELDVLKAKIQAELDVLMAKIQADHEEELDVLKAKAKIQAELDVLKAKIQADYEEELDVLKAKIQAELDVLKAKIQADYEEELDVLKATGHTRDAWCYITVYTAAGKFMVDIVVVIISRFLVGAGYLESVRQTLFERPWDGWIRQYAELETVQRAIYFIFGEM